MGRPGKAPVTGKQFFELLARLPARVWLQAVLAIVGFVVLAVLGFAVIAGVGTRHYYRRLGYELQGPYMVQQLRPPEAAGGAA